MFVTNSQELDTGAASLYVYVRNTAELHAAMLDELLGQVDLGPVTADPRESRDFARGACSVSTPTCA